VGRREYWGKTYREDISMDRASIDNPESFWPTRASLFNLLADVGFTTVSEVHVPAIPEVDSWRDHIVVVATKGAPQPAFDPPERATWPERLPLNAHPTQGLRWRMLERFRRMRGGGVGAFFR
jgi:hypothetical protein